MFLTISHYEFRKEIKISNF